MTDPLAELLKPSGTELHCDLIEAVALALQIANGLGIEALRAKQREAVVLLQAAAATAEAS